MKKYYTRVCNFYYGSHAKSLIKKRRALPLNGNLEISFDHIEIFFKRKNQINTFKRDKKITFTIKKKN